jgi:hypothetical protein
MLIRKDTEMPIQPGRNSSVLIFSFSVFQPVSVSMAQLRDHAREYREQFPCFSPNRINLFGGNPAVVA